MKGLKVYLDMTTDQVADPMGTVEDCSMVGHWATGDSRFKLLPGDDIEYAMSLIRQSYDLTL